MAVKIRTLVISSLLILLIVLFAFGQSMHVNTKIPFAFTVAGKVLPAGQYDFSVGTNFQTIQVRGLSASASAIAVVVTRLAGALHATPQDSHIVFDKVGDVYTLSEVWPLTGDGYLVSMAKGTHEHAVVNVPK